MRKRPPAFRVVVAFLFVLTAAQAAAAMPLYVAHEGFPTLTLEVEPSDTIENIKQKLNDARAYLVADLSLAFNGTPLAEGHTLQDYGINGGATIDLSMPAIVVTTLNSTGPGSLQQALVDAHPGYTITFAVTGTIALPGATFLAKDLRIAGPGASLLSVRHYQWAVLDNGQSAVSIEDLTLSGIGITDQDSGAVYNAGTLRLVDVVISDNRARIAPHGAGVTNHGQLTMIGTTITGNTGAGSANGSAMLNIGTAVLVNSTISGNAFTGALAAPGIVNVGSLQIVHSTIVHQDGLIAFKQPAGTASTTLANSMVVSTGPACSIVGPFSVVGASFATDATCPATTTVTEAQLALGPLGDNGGPTPTHALVGGSVAIDAVPAGDCGAAVDQRGLSRIEPCDAGAYEADSTPPVLSVPDPITAEATGPDGAVVTYEASAVDDQDPSPDVECFEGYLLPDGQVIGVGGSGESGSVFAIGVTHLVCTATDAAGNFSAAAFTVTVNDAGPAAKLAALKSQVAGLGLPHGTQSSLLAKLNNGGCGPVGAFMNEVKAQSGKKLTVAQAAQLLAAAADLKAALGCK